MYKTTERENLFSQNHVFHFVRVGGSIFSFVHIHVRKSITETNGDQYKTLPDTREEKKVYKHRKRDESFNVRIIVVINCFRSPLLFCFPQTDDFEYMSK